ncbi:MAG: hypothetical protein B6244_01420 [Candidatus Cloacimonetes bacterium 4572_55]|nr:MAG: hypothetical protein B6244_01420 [Candidatus Cloacimonetes bacterium 4572_55]
MAADTDKVFRKFKKLKSDRKYDKAVDLLKEELRKSPRQYDLIVEQSKILIELGREQKALPLLNRVWSAHPARRDDVLIFLQKTRLDLGILGAETSEQNDLGLINFFLFQKYLIKRDLTSADQILTSLDSDQIQELYSGFQSKASRFEKIATPGSVGSADLTPFYGILTIQKFTKKWNSARQTIWKIAKLSDRELPALRKEIDSMSENMPDDINLRLTKARIVFQQMEWIRFGQEIKYLLEKKRRLPEDLCDNVQTVVQQNPDLWGLKLSLSVILLRKNETPQALDMLKHTGWDHPESLPKVLALLEGLIHTGRKEPIIRQIIAEFYLKKNHVDQATKNLLSIVRTDPDQAGFMIQLCQNYLADNPEAISLYYPLGDALQLAGRINDSIQSYLQILKVDKSKIRQVARRLISLLEQHENNESAHFALASILTQAGFYQNAAITLHHLCTISPQTTDTVLQCLEKLANYEQIQTYVLSRMIQIYFDMDRLEDALKTADRLIRIDRNHLEFVLIESDQYGKKHLEKIPNLLRFYRELSMRYSGHFLPRLAAAEAYFAVETYDKSALIYKQVALLHDQKAGYIIERLKGMLELKPDFLPALQEMYDIYLEYHDIESAAKILDAFENKKLVSLKDIVKYFYMIIDREPLNKNLRLGFARIYKRNDLPEHTIQVCDEALESLPTPDHASFNLIKAQCLIELHQIDEAARLFHIAYKLDHQLADKIIHGLKQILDIHPTLVPARDLLATVYLEQNFLEEAILEYLYLAESDSSLHGEILELFEKINKEEITNARVTMGLGDLYVILEKIEPAIDSYKKTARLDPSLIPELPNRYEELLKNYAERTDLHLSYANILINISQFDRALGHLEHAYQIDPSLQNVLVGKLRQILKKDSENSEARKKLVHIFVRQKALKQACNLLLELLRLEEGNVEFVMEKSLEILRENKKFTPIHWVLTQAHIVREDLDAALVRLKSIVELDRNQLPAVIAYFAELEKIYQESSPFLFAYGDLLALNGDYAEAQELFWSISWKETSELSHVIERLENLVQYQSRSTRLQNFIGELYLRKNDFEQALRCFKKGMRLVHGGDLMVELYMNLSRVYSLIGDEKQAEREFTRACKFDPQQQVVFQKMRQIRETAWKHQLLNGTTEIKKQIQLHRKLGQYEQALDKIKGIEPTLDNRREKLQIYLQQNRPDFLIESASVDREVKDDPTALYLQGVAYKRLHNLPAHIATLKKQLSNDPTRGRIREKIADSYQQLALGRLCKRSPALIDRTTIS